ELKLSDCPKLSNKGKLAHSFPYLLNENWLVASRSFQESLHQRPIGFALGFHRSIAILVHRGGNMRVTHEFLLHAYWRSSLVQPSTIGVAERMEPDPSKSQLKTCWYQIVGTNR